MYNNLGHTVCLYWNANDQQIILLYMHSIQKWLDTIQPTTTKPLSLCKMTSITKIYRFPKKNEKPFYVFSTKINLNCIKSCDFLFSDSSRSSLMTKKNL